MRFFLSGISIFLVVFTQSTIVFSQSINSEMTLNKESRDPVSLIIPTNGYGASSSYYSTSDRSVFLQFDIGAQRLFAEDDNQMPNGFLKLLTPSFNFSIGKWFNDYVGVRVQGGGFRLKGWNANNGRGIYSYHKFNAWTPMNEDPYIKNYNITPFSGEGYVQKFRYWDAHMDLLVNISRLIAGPTHTYPVDFVAILGFGFGGVSQKIIDEIITITPATPVFKLGIASEFQFREDMKITFELQDAFAFSHFDGQQSGEKNVDYFRKYDNYLALKVGYQYFLPKRKPSKMKSY